MKNFSLNILLMCACALANAQHEFSESTSNPFDVVTSSNLAVPALGDIDGDGDLDLFIGQNGNNDMKYYENTGSAVSPEYTQRVDAENPLDIYTNNSGGNAPVLVDIDADGDLDAFVGNWTGTIKFYENTGTSASPNYTPRTGENNPLDLVSTVNSFSYCAFVDMDGDNDLDVVVTDGGGQIQYYRNDGTVNAPSFVEDAAGNPFSTLSTNERIKFIFYDLSGDGLEDAILARPSSIDYYLNTGTSSSPVFSLQSENPFSQLNLTLGAVQLADVTGDGLPELVTGENGSMRMFIQPIISIPDANLKLALLSITELNTTDDGEISHEEAAAFNGALNLSNLGISDPTGLEFFSNLTILDLSRNAIGSIDVSANVSLTELVLSNTGLTTLDVSDLTQLTVLYVDDNNLSTLDVTNNTQLEDLRFHFNNISSIDVTGMPNLRVMYAMFNSLTSCDLSQNPLLDTFWSGGNDFASIDLTHNPLLEYLFISGTSLTSIDVSNNPNLISLILDDNALTSLDLSQLSVLTRLEVDGNTLTEISVSHLPNLQYLRVQNNNLESLTVKNGNNSGISASNFDATGNPNLTCIAVSDLNYATTNWTSIDTGVTFTDTYCDPLDPVFIPDAQFKAALLSNTSINTTDDGEISYAEAEAYTESIVATELNIADLTGIEAFINLTQLDVSENILSSIDVSNNTILERLDLKDNHLTTIDLSQNTELEYLSIYNNNFTSLDVSANAALTDLILRNNSITSLDLSGNLLLTYINVMGNGMTSLTIGENEVLEYLAMDFNDFTEFDISGYPNINQIAFSGNSQLESMNVANGNNSNFLFYRANDNPLLTCVTVDDPGYSETNWTLVDDHVGYSTDCSNDATDILTFTVDGMVGNATIDATNHTVEATVNSTVNLSSVEPTISVSDGATISPSGAQDFTGSVTYTVSAEDNSTTQDWVVTLSPLPLGMNDQEIAVYPNPTSGSVRIAGVEGLFNTSVINMDGKVVRRSRNEKALNFSDLESGLYLVKIESRGSNQTFRIMKTN